MMEFLSDNLFLLAACMFLLVIPFEMQRRYRVRRPILIGVCCSLAFLPIALTLAMQLQWSSLVGTLLLWLVIAAACVVLAYIAPEPKEPFV